MKKAKISDSEMKLILLLLALLLLAAAYFLGYRRSVNAAVALEEQNKTDQETVNRLEDMKIRRPQVEASTENLKQAIQDIIAKYPADLTTEKAIAIVQDIELYSPVLISSISFRMDNLLMNFTRTSQEVPTPPTGYSATLGLNYSTTYEGFKNMMRYIAAREDRMTVPAVSVTYDPVTDLVSGTITFNMFYLWNTGKEYVPPVIYGVDKGVDSIFGAGEGIMTLPDESEADTDAEADTTGEDAAEE